ncbi:MAG: hypothetical protein AUK47_24565 [Deltaproteobacteria bacterium CG2_30_63_29]|nr:MAG: hypothetical protein AUK47_24565 [Deltaproteobacteria bacterium CG2_30_63_29]
MHHRNTFPLLFVLALFVTMAASTACDDSSATEADATLIDADGGGDVSGDQTLIDVPDVPEDQLAETTDAGPDGPDLSDTTTGGALGDDCVLGTDCQSSHCVETPDSSGAVCSSCSLDVDCFQPGTCSWDDTTGYYGCKPTTLSGLGTICTAADECDSGFCATTGAATVCSLCAQSSDCGLQQQCGPSPLGYLVCSGTGALGASCNSGAECVAGTFCNSGICSECGTDVDCLGGGTCMDGTASVGFYVCAGGLGDLCAADSECGLGHCYTGGSNTGVCSSCKLASDCGLQQTCTYDASLAYAVCEGTGPLGAACQTDDQCVSGVYCNSGICSECAVNADCTDGGLCVDDRASSGLFICAGGLGEACTLDADCTSTFCFDNNGQGVCSECGLAADCGLQLDCLYRGVEGYALCVGTGDLGAACQTTAQCAAGTFCNSNLCSECMTSSDCPTNAACVNDPTAGAFICKLPLGAACANSTECASNYCYARGMGFSACSLCETDADCTTGTCTFNWNDPYALCVGSGNLGDACTAGGDCDTGFCTNNFCSECGVAADCGAGGACVADPAGTSGLVCLDGYGTLCQTDADCGSGFCYDAGFYSMCSECLTDADCPGQQCAFTLGRYAVCVGMAALGETCVNDSDCESEVCTNSVCSECHSDGDCQADNICGDDGSGYSTCYGGLRSPCDDNTQCVSGFCYTSGNFWEQVCSECSSDADCANNNCNFAFGRGYAACQ